MSEHERGGESAPERIVIPLTRRGFCSLAVKCAAVGLASCMAGEDKLVSIGDLNDAGHGASAPDSGSAAHPDAHAKADARPGSPDAPAGDPDAEVVDTPDAMVVDPPDAASGGPTCNGSVIDVGGASSFAEGTATYFSTYRMYVARDAGGLYALSANCTHRGTAVQDKTTYFYCPSHGARFDMNGGIISGPVSVPLPHFAMCVLDNGNVAVDKTRTVSPSDRLSV
jgi:nitrite reductase/ring-hydroxylating ferredoxin subunit